MAIKSQGYQPWQLKYFLLCQHALAVAEANTLSFAMTPVLGLPNEIVHCIVRAAVLGFFSSFFFPLSSVLIFPRIAVFKTSNNICEITQCI